jgi:hypothetical protein
MPGKLIAILAGRGSEDDEYELLFADGWTAEQARDRFVAGEPLLQEGGEWVTSEWLATAGTTLVRRDAIVAVYVTGD